MTKEEQRASILNMLRDHKINVNDAILMLNQLDEENTSTSESITKHPLSQEKSQKTYQTLIEDIVDQVISGMNMERVYKIMEDMKWTYVNSPATRKDILDCAKDNIRNTLQQLVCNYTDHDEAFAMIGTGGFLCRAWVDEGDEDNIQVELGFQPVTGYGDGHLTELIKAKTREM